jgi:predicted nucleotide-binding protein
MTNVLSDQLRDEADTLDKCAAGIHEDGIEQLLRRFGTVAQQIAQAWSGSSLGYHSRVYYEDFKPPPPGAYFSVEWGFYPATMGRTVGDWREYRHEDILQLVIDRAGNPDMSMAQRRALEAKDTFERARSECLSILSIFLEETNDSFTQSLKAEIEQLEPLSETRAVRVQLPSNVMSRDQRALSEGPTGAPHQEILARVVALQSNFQVCSKLATLARRGASHIDRVVAARATKGVRMGGKVFIGHGGSPVWRELKDFIQDELGLQCDEFNGVEVAGKTTVDRLKQMLDEAAFAFLILTAEDERLDGKVTARENVIHEAGLFQGRLGFERAIIMLESGCNEFSNIHGLSQLRFDSGKIDGLFDRVRRTLKREGLIT